MFDTNPHPGQCLEVCIISLILKAISFLKEKHRCGITRPRHPLCKTGRKTAKNLHEAFYILDKISHKSNFSPTEGGCSGKQLGKK